MREFTPWPKWIKFMFTLPVFLFPTIDPVIVQFGPLAIRWYSLAYVAGLLIGWWYVLRLVGAPGAKDAAAAPTRNMVDDFLVWAVLAVILGGRLGYVLFYKPDTYLANPAEIIAVWRGGMSFHGGLLGMAVAAWAFTRRHGLGFFALADLISCAAPIGLFFGRIANFINAELYGRISEAPWAVIFPGGGPLARHPSQLYESFLEGAVLFSVLWYAFFHTSMRHRPGALSGLFLVGYGLARFLVEFVRQPDDHLGFLFAGATMGQLLTLPMILIGLYLAWLKPAEGS